MTTSLPTFNHGPAYGLSRECQLKAEAKFDLQLAAQAVEWIRAVTGEAVRPPHGGPIQDGIDFADALKDGIALCQLGNALLPGSIKKINTMSAPFKQVSHFFSIDSRCGRALKTLRLIRWRDRLRCACPLRVCDYL